MSKLCQVLNCQSNSSSTEHYTCKLARRGSARRCPWEKNRILKKKSNFLSLCYPRDTRVLSDFCPFGQAVWAAVAKMKIYERRALLYTHLWSLSKSKFNLKSTASTLLHRLVLLNVCFIYPMSGRHSKNWDRKGWPGSENQMYPCI